MQNENNRVTSLECAPTYFKSLATCCVSIQTQRSGPFLISLDNFFIGLCIVIYNADFPQIAVFLFVFFSQVSR